MQGYKAVETLAQRVMIYPADYMIMIYPADYMKNM